jgi:predicted NAD-dependent protein-ADP-ribosyltransferase YbiA (DUF1768 family)
LIQDLSPVQGNRELSAKTITLKANVKDSYSENLYTGMMRELRDSKNPDLRELYDDLINVSILQGTGQSAVSIRNIIPIEDYAAKIAPIFQQLQASNMLESFENAMFERNNFTNPELFEEFRPVIWKPFPNINTGEYAQENYMFDPITGEDKLIHVFPNFSIKGFPNRTLIKLSEKYNSFQLASDFIKVPKIIKDNEGKKFNVATGTEIGKADYAYMMSKGDFNLFDAYYYKKVYTKTKDEFGNFIPLSTYDEKTGRQYYYKLINVYGDGNRAVEMNTNFTPSVIDNGSMRIANETSDDQIVSMINPGSGKQVVPLPIKETPKQMVGESIGEPKGVKVISQDYGVVQAETNPNAAKKQEFLDLIKPQIQAQTYKENVGKGANQMFHFGKMWSRVTIKAKPIKINSFAPTATRDRLIDSGENAKGNSMGISEYTYAYHELDQNGNPLPGLSTLQPIIDEIQNALGIDMSNYDSVIGNIYQPNEFIYPHKDVTESKSAEGYPVIVYTMGANAGLGIVDNNKGKMTFANQYDDRYLRGNEKLSGYTNEVITKDGSIYTFGLEGKGRFQLTHSTPINDAKVGSQLPITLPNGNIITNYTITLTFRRAADLEPGMPSKPAITSETTVTQPKPSTSVKPTQDTINIYASTGENAELSNFAVRPFVATLGVKSLGNFQTVEGAFQAAKLLYTDEGLSDLNQPILDQLQVANGKTAKSIGRDIQDLNIEDWNENSSDIMKELLKQSFEQNPNALAKLLATGNAELTHTQDNTKWGKLFPKLLMEVRQELGATQPSTSVENVEEAKEENLFTTKINQFTYSYNPSTQEVIHNSKTGDKIETNETQIGKVLAEYAKANNLLTQSFNNQDYSKVGDRVVNVNNGSIVTQKQILDLFQEETNLPPMGEQVDKPSIFESRNVQIDYTRGQTEALTDIANLIDKGGDGYYLLAGYAGTGKTTIAENIAKYGTQSGKAISVLAPTNKAAKVLNDKLKSTGVASEPTTIHKAIYGEPDPDTGEWVAKSDIKNSVIIVDESSMIAKEVMEDLLRLTKGKNNTIIFMGDSFQLEPVGEDSGLFKGKVTEVNNSKSELTEVKRQSLDSDILKVATVIRNDKVAYVPETSTEDFKITNSKNEFIQNFKQSVKNNDDVAMIVATNAERIFMNKLARGAKFGENVENIINPNETIISIANSSEYSNSELFNVKDLRGEPTKHSITFTDNYGKESRYDIYLAYVVNDNNKEIPILLLPEIDKPSVYHAQILKAARESSRELYNALSGWIFTTNRGAEKLSPALTIGTYGYAITAHKSQGSQWNKVYVNQNYVIPGSDAARWFYTAVTRAAKEVEIFPTRANTIIKNSDIDAKLNNIVVENLISLKDGNQYSPQEINSTMLEQMGYSPEEIGKILKEIC